MARRVLRLFGVLLLAAAARTQLPSSSNDWLQLIADYARKNVDNGESGPQWAFASISRPVVRGAEDLKPSILPVLVVPVPVESKKTPTQECQISSGSETQPEQYDNTDKQKQHAPYKTSTKINNDIPEEAFVNYPKRPYTTPSYDFITEVDTTPVPPFHKVAPSKQLVEWFRLQKPNAPYEPPLKLSNFDLSERMPPPLPSEVSQESPVPLPPPRLRVRPGSPPRPRFLRPLRLRGLLTVPRADYSEPYTVWWDPVSGGARIDYHGGSATTFRSIDNGKVYYVETHVQRSRGRAERLCAVGLHQPASPQDFALPVLPADLDQFYFVGYVRSVRAEGELWRRLVVGGVGQLGAARGEALTTRHDLLLARDGDRVVPLWYTVSVNSSVLGQDIDGYHHKYFDVVEQQHPPTLFKLDLNKTCTQLEYLDASVPEQRARLEPLREFTLPHRDPRYDNKLTEFVAEYTRNYQDDLEEALRKNLLMQTDRFVSSGNRQGSTARLGVNFLSDRLNREQEELVGVPPGAGPPGAQPFPLSAQQISAEPLPKEFNWRSLGGVTHVRQQGSCYSCWAFAATGAVEGALFKRTGRLVPLSENYLLDCADDLGVDGSKKAWPSDAFFVIEDKGLPALANYTSHKPEVDTCNASEPVTKISKHDKVPQNNVNALKVDPCDATKPVTKISKHVKVPQNNVDALKIAIRDFAPTVVVIDGSCNSFKSYESGVIYDERCGNTTKEINHAVLAVGWGEEKGMPHFILKNSFGPEWGKEDGFLRVQGPGNTCGVLTNAAYPVLQDKDVIP